ncbi:uncharacterized protein PAC_07534 [Phialocephala subalpina]|uniref:Myb-like domain-containing protein n=1 Tax=Phialocephala subalpina TaxID=576137 RepID=A0A1L7WY16_9HELO|nr:uncharacterized protein PAC_07534 [Phialocephala subalpina]
MSSSTQPTAGLTSTGLESQSPKAASSSSESIPSQTTSYKTPNENTISLNADLHCPHENRHGYGFFCPTCRSIPMEWGMKLPRFYASGNLVKVGPSGGAVEGVQLQDEEAIAVLSTIIYADVRGIHYANIPGLLALMEKHPKSVEAGQRLAEMYQIIHRASRNEPEDTVLVFYELVERCLQNPRQPAKKFVIKELSKLAQFQDLPDGLEPEIPPQTFKTGSQQPVTKASTPDQDEDGGEQLNWIKRPNLTAAQAHTPAQRGNWKFVDGTDLRDAVVGKPEPWKWFLVHEDKDDPSKIDVRQYPKIQDFDWNDPNCVNAFNKNRKQIIDRTEAPQKDSRPPWTIQEKKVLEQLIREDLKAGKTGKTLDWNSIAERLEKNFETVLQKEGTALAQTSRKVKWVFPLKKDPKLAKERLGPANRSGSAVNLQAKKYHDILALMDGSVVEDGSSKIVGMMGNGGDGIGHEANEGILGNGSPTLKKRKRMADEELETGQAHVGGKVGSDDGSQGYMTVTSNPKAPPKTPTPKRPKKDTKGKTPQTLT